jgi:hypothetical protein
MSRTLSEKDQAILKKLAPELAQEVCPGSGHEYYSILPPVSNHFSDSDQDFLERIKRLSREELKYLADLIMDGRESIGCVRPEHIILFADQVADLLSADLAERIIGIYTTEGSCD